MEILKTIIEVKKVGELIKVDKFTAKGINVGFPRSCVNAEIEMIKDRKVIVPDE